jgi:hypothetical protein
MNSKEIELTLHDIHCLSFNDKDIQMIIKLFNSMHIYKYIIKKIYITKSNKFLIYNESRIFNSILIILNDYNITTNNTIVVKYYITRLNNIYLLGITYNIINYHCLNKPLDIKFYLLSDIINIICMNFINIKMYNIECIVELLIEDNNLIKKYIKKKKNKCIIF